MLNMKKLSTFRKKETKQMDSPFGIYEYKVKMSWADDVMLRVITVDRGRVEKKVETFGLLILSFAHHPSAGESTTEIFIKT